MIFPSFPNVVKVVLGILVVINHDGMSVLRGFYDGVELLDCIKYCMLIPGVMPEESFVVVANLPKIVILNEVLVSPG